MDTDSPDFPRLWLDGVDALEKAAARSDLTSDQAQALADFSRQGWCCISLRSALPSVDQVQEEIDTIWQRRPVDLAYLLVDAPRSMSDAHPRRHRRPPYRILDPHSHSPALREVYLQAEIFSWAELLLGEKAVAFRSVLTEFGSRQIAIRDAVNLAARPLLSAWVALEDIHPKAGPPLVYSGSHRMPFHEFEAGRILIDSEEEYLPAYRFTLKEARRRGLEPEVLTPRRGEVIFRHPALFHGAQAVRHPGRKRRALQIHYSASAAMKTCDGAYLKSVRGRFWRREERLFWNETSLRLEGEGTQGFQNPLHGLDPRGAGLLEKLRGRAG